MFSKKIIKKIPIIKRLYPSLMKRLYNNKIIFGIHVIIIHYN